MHRFLILGSLALVAFTGCGVASEGGSGEQLGEQSDALAFTNTYWRQGTANPRKAQCANGDVMIGAAINGNTAMVKCASPNPPVDTKFAYDGDTTLLGIKQACLSPYGAAFGWTENLTDGKVTARCGSLDGYALAANYLDGPGTGTWGQEWFTWGGAQVFGHVCKKAGYVVRAYDLDLDQFVCGF